jgi:superfamily I DNA/RNA helicase
MQLTPEQRNIIDSTGDIKINAVAGSGKTTTIIEYAKARPKKSGILYLAFNKSVRLEAQKKFEDAGLDNVSVETAHSIAYKNIVFRNQYNLRPQGYKTYEIAELLGLHVSGEQHAEYIVANHINKFLTYFCNSDKAKVQELNYLDVVSDSDAKIFVTEFYEYIEKQTRLLLSKMDKGEIEITHDFYLKKFQVACPNLNYDYILFDEGQDASLAMLDVFLKQEACKVIVGDTHQQIYGWRYAVNSLEKADFKTLHLTNSFRLSQDIANLAVRILDLKNYIKEHKKVKITGSGNFKGNKSTATLARTNLGLLTEAIRLVTEKKHIDTLYFEGNFNSYTYADEGASLYDVLNLYNKKRTLIRDVLIKKMKDIDELEDYIKKTNDIQLGIMVDIVKDYGDSIPGILKTIKEKHVDDDKKQKAEMIFSTVHRCKGMEYDSVILANDFISESKLKKMLADTKDKEPDLDRLNEEINLLYVAITRSKNILNLPESLLPEEFPYSPKINVLRPKKDDLEDRLEKFKYQTPSKKTYWNKSKNNFSKKDKSYSVEKFRESHEDAYKPWTESQDATLIRMYNAGKNANFIADYFGRTLGSIRARFKKLKLF